MLVILLEIIFVSFLLNLVWEIAHSLLYNTCQRMSVRQYIPLILIMSFKDSLWTSAIYAFTATLFRDTILITPWPLGIFFILALFFSFFDEKISLKLGRWKYAQSMPTILEVGITPLFEIAVTGVFSLLIVFKLLN